MKKRALITGITGQDGSYLAENLLSKDYEVFGLVRRTSTGPHYPNLTKEVLSKVRLIPGDMTDQGSLSRAVIEAAPDEVYNLAAQSFVGGSWQYPVTTFDIVATGTIRLLEALRNHNPRAKFYQASSSEMFGNVGGNLDENSPFKPRSPYGVAKAAAHYAAVNYRESFGMFVCCGILFNHESPRRGIEFVTRKVTDGVAKITLGLIDKIHLGNLNAARDWGFAPDYVDAMRQMLQLDQPDDYVVATGATRTIGDLCQIAFGEAGITDWERYVDIDPQLKRPAELHTLTGNAAKIKQRLGWKPITSFEQMIKLMVSNDIRSMTE